MEHQKGINEKMRIILIDWIDEVHIKFGMKSETFFMTACIIDRFLSEREISRSMFQLLGCGAMMIAAKYEEVYPPDLLDFVHIADGAYKKNDLIKMEEVFESFSLLGHS